MQQQQQQQVPNEYRIVTQILSSMGLEEYDERVVPLLVEFLHSNYFF